MHKIIYKMKNYKMFIFEQIKIAFGAVKHISSFFSKIQFLSIFQRCVEFGFLDSYSVLGSKVLTLALSMTYD